ncbi:MAG: hypothetical protein EBT09_01990 [Actinobacteria bacterium]|nr:hypothetical protein [Actinomycetota bacterium]
MVGHDAEGVAQDRDLAEEEAGDRPHADQFCVQVLGPFLVQLARVMAGQGGSVAQGINAYAQVEGNMGHGNVRGPCQREGMVMEHRAIR